MENVTERVRAAAKPGADRCSRRSTRGGPRSRRIEKESLDKTGLRSDVVTLYAGGEYWLYRYKKYTDVRLVFAPEQQAAFFGGDPDNFTYPRYDLDMALFRVYENGRPIQSSALPQVVGRRAPRANDLVFVVRPSGLDRSAEDRRAARVPARRAVSDLAAPRSNAGWPRCATYGERGPEQARQTTDFVFGTRELAARRCPAKREGLADTEDLREEAEGGAGVPRAHRRATPSGRRRTARPGTTSRARRYARAQLYKPFRFRALRGSSLAGARVHDRALRAGDREAGRASGSTGFHDAQLESLKLEPALAGAALSGAGHRGARRRAAAVARAARRRTIRSSRRRSAARRRPTRPRLRSAARSSPIRRSERRSSTAARPRSNASTDPLIVLARNVEPIVRETTKTFEGEVESVESSAGEKLGRARFAAYGKSAYPDATFTLRLSFGTVTGYPMNGTQAPPVTTFYGLYDRSQSFGMKPPFNLPAALHRPARPG